MQKYGTKKMTQWLAELTVQLWGSEFSTHAKLEMISHVPVTPAL